MVNVMREYQVIGRKSPTEKEVETPIYRMRIFAKDHVRAKSKFWYYMKTLKRVKKTKGEILCCEELVEEDTNQVRNYGIFLRYTSRSGVHNMHKEYRDVTRAGAVDQMYAEMAGRHRACQSTIQIIEVCEMPADGLHRVDTKQFANGDVKFPVVSRIPRAPHKRYRARFTAHYPTTFAF